MRRLLVLALIVISSLIVSMVAPAAYPARAAASKLPVVVLVQRSYFVAENQGCRIDVEGQEQVLLKVNDAEGRRRGGAWLAKGEVINTTGPGGKAQNYCAYARLADVETTGEVDLLLHDVYLTTIDLDAYEADTHIVLEVDRQGLIAEDTLSPSQVTAMGLEPLQATTSAAPTPTTTATGITRTTRARTSTSPTPTSESGVRRGTTRSTTTTPTRQQTGIITGEWELEGASEWDMFYVSISRDFNRTGPEIVAEIDPTEFAVELGAPLIGEGQAPVGCRIFAYSGPLGLALYIGMCADGEHIFYAGGTDKAILDEAMEDFSDGEPFEIPRGYTETF